MRGGQPNDGGAGGANADEAVRRAAGGSPGAFAGVVLAPAAAPSIAVDVLVQSGASADQPTLDAVRSLLASHSGKSVTLRSPIAITAAGDVHSADQIRQLADQHGTAQGSGRAVIHLLYLTGQYTDENALGVTVRGDTVAVFPDQIASSATPFVSRARIERAVVTHEIGHVLGLVDLFLDDHRDDPEHPGHSSNTRSVMYWAVEADIVAQVLDGPPPVDFDADDNADLARIHSGAAHA
jgi:hypothetical protein